MKIKILLSKLSLGPKFGLYAFAIITILFLSTYRLSSIVPGLSQREVDFRASSQSIKEIAKSPDNAHYKLAERGLLQINQASARNLRAVSVVFGLLAVAFLYYSLKTWYDRRLAVMSTFLFASSAWYLHVARIALPLVMLLTGITALIAYGTWIINTKKYKLALLGAALLFIYSLFTPGLVWFVLAAAFWQQKLLIDIAKKAGILVSSFAVLLVLAAITPIAWAGIVHPYVLDNILGLNQLLHLNIKESLLNIGRIPYQLIYRGPGDSVLWLGRLPLLDVVTLLLAVVGGYTYFYERSLKRVKLLVGIVFVSTILIAINGTSYMILILPVVYFLSACGLELLFDQWFAIFPKNPFARITAISLVLVTLFLAGFYHLNHYFIAWPNAPETRQAFQLKDR